MQIQLSRPIGRGDPVRGHLLPTGAISSISQTISNGEVFPGISFFRFPPGIPLMRTSIRSTQAQGDLDIQVPYRFFSLECLSSKPEKLSVFQRDFLEREFPGVYGEELHEIVSNMRDVIAEASS